MIAYGGGKKRYGKEIYEEIIKHTKNTNEVKYNTYIEPFCGYMSVGLNFINKIDLCIFSDINPYISYFLKELRQNDKFEIPKDINKQEYKQIMKCLKCEMKESKTELIKKGYYSIAFSFGGIFGAGYRLSKCNKKNIINLASLLNKNKDNIIIENKSYLEYSPKNSIIYCDPPYKNNKFNSKYFSNFNHDLFWNTMREWSKPENNNLVIISEYEAPNDFICIWEKNTNTCFNSKVKERTEKLFKLSPLPQP